MIDKRGKEAVNGDYRLLFYLYTFLITIRVLFPFTFQSFLRYHKAIYVLLLHLTLFLRIIQSSSHHNKLHSIQLKEIDGYEENPQ